MYPFVRADILYLLSPSASKGRIVKLIYNTYTDKFGEDFNK